MAGMCDLALAIGLTLGGACQQQALHPEPMPADEPAAWAIRPPAPKEEPKPAPPMPPVVIKQEVVREVIREVPAPTPPAPPPPPPPGPDPVAEAVRISYAGRAARNASQAAISAPSELDDDGDIRPGSMPVLPGVVGQEGTGYQEKSVTSSQPVDNSRIITTDRYIPGILETGINTQLDGSVGGPVVIQVTRDVYGYHGRNILVPKGSRLVCGNKTLEKVGSSRAPFRCSRVLLGESRAEIIGIKANVTDVQGALGVSGDVDNRFFERYGTAFILAGISAAVRAASASSQSTSTTSTASATGSSSTYNSGGALSTGGQELSQRLGEITAATLEQTLNLTPILKVAQGTRVVVRPDTDWYIANVE